MLRFVRVGGGAVSCCLCEEDDTARWWWFSLCERGVPAPYEGVRAAEDACCCAGRRMAVKGAAPSSWCGSAPLDDETLPERVEAVVPLETVRDLGPGVVSCSPWRSLLLVLERVCRRTTVAGDGGAVRLDVDDDEEGEMPSVLSMVEMSSGPATSSICRLERDVRLLAAVDIVLQDGVEVGVNNKGDRGSKAGSTSCRRSEEDAKQSSIACIHGHYGALIGYSGVI